MLSVVVLNLNYNDEQKLEGYFIVQSLFTLAFDILATTYLFLYGFIYEMHNNEGSYIFLIQILLGFIQKSIILLFVLVEIHNNLLSFTNLLQLISVFLGIVSLQGIGFILLQDLRICMIILVWKVLLSIVETLILSTKQLPFFGCLPQQHLSILALSTAINLVCLPVDYSPFYDENSLMYQSVDFKFEQISTQPSITIIKGGQLIDCLFMLLTVKIFNLIPENNSYFLKYYALIVVCFLLNICLQVYHILNRYFSYNNEAHTYFHQNTVSLDRLQQILKNSQKPRYLRIDIVTQCQNLNYNKKQREEIFKSFMSMCHYDKQIIEINNGLLCKYSTNCQVDSRYFFEEILNYIQNEAHMRIIDVRNLNEYQILQVKQAVVERIFKLGVNINLRQTLAFLNQQNSQLYELIKDFESEILKFLTFQKTISLYFSTNPKFIYYDLYETDLP